MRWPDLSAVLRRAVAVGFASTLGTHAFASDPALVEAAKKDGAVTVYACEPALTPTYIKEFQKAYPEIRISSYQAGCLALLSRHTNERAAGKQVASIFLATEDAFVRMQKQGFLADYRSPEAANFGKFIAPKNELYQKFRVLIAGPTINTQALAGAPLPADWTDFAKPPEGWKGKINFFDPRTSSSALLIVAGLKQNFGADGAAAIYKGMIGANAELAGSTAAATPKLYSGEKPIQMYSITSIYSSGIAKGAPLKFVIPKSGVLPLPFAIGLLDGAPNPNAGKLFIDFMLTKGQEITEQANEYALRDGSKPPKDLPALADMKMLPLDVGAALDQEKDLVKWWQDATGFR